MLLFRAMNDFDIEIDPIKNGLVSKKMIYDTTKRYLYNIDRETMEKMPQKERNEYIKAYMHKYIFDHKHKLFKIFRKENNETKDIIHRHVENKDKFACCEIIRDLSTLPNHLVNGSKTYTNWISATDKFDCLWNYYDRQNIHEVAVLDVYTNGVFDENTYIVDLSNRETINSIKFLSNKIDKNNFDSFIEFIIEKPEFQESMMNIFSKYVMTPTNKRFMGFNFSSAGNEYCIYKYLPKESIVSVLESLQIDLICADIFNEEYLKLSVSKQIQQLKKLKNMILQHIIEENNPYMLYVFGELYLKKHNIYEITNCKEEQEKMLLMRNEIISKSRLLPNILIKRKK